ncbi:uncharacterized protein LOC122084581 [Macadamia integrifolia]|uniref:uncharacterized protein LOC122084581 n=1 Tax=Macadamia integrifolia TaxID=60698 RepID=UPI001C4FA180|nr:uncharacterized protein LOC122084581 [Macadamia integrifolia]
MATLKVYERKKSTMASQEGSSQTSRLKILIDKNNRVVMAEAESDFVDILLSFLTMSMGTIVRLISKEPQPATLGSMTTLYKEVENLEKQQLLQTQACKSMLLYPRNPSENECRKLKLKLKLNVDNTEPIKYYICVDWNCSRRGTGGLYTTFKNVRCNCGKMMAKKICREKEKEAASPVVDGGGFVYGKTKYMVTDDLRIEPMSTATILTQLRKLGLKDMSSLQETTLNIGSEEILKLLKGILFSKTPLTDVFLRKQEFTSEGLKFEMGDLLQSSLSSAEGLNLKLMVNKSTKKVLYAEAREDMVDFLLSFLAFPLGSILRLLGGNSSLGSMDNLYRSVECSRVTRDDSVRELLLQPVLSRGFGCSSNPLGVKESEQPPSSLWCRSVQDNYNYSHTGCLTTEKPDMYCSSTFSQLRFVNPKSPTSETAGHGGFLKGPETFFITDDLVFTPIDSFWSLSFLKSMEFPLDDLEVRTVKVGMVEALRLLKASLLSKSVLTDALVNFARKIPKEEK